MTFVSPDDFCISVLSCLVGVHAPAHLQRAHCMIEHYFAESRRDSAGYIYPHWKETSCGPRVAATGRNSSA